MSNYQSQYPPQGGQQQGGAPAPPPGQQGGGGYVCLLRLAELVTRIF